MDRVEAERATVLPSDDLAARQRRRDHRIMAFIGHKRMAATDIDDKGE